MSHIDDTTRDFEGLKNYGPALAESIKQARIEARCIIDLLEPFHIGGWPDLISKLEDALERAKLNAGLLRYENLKTAPTSTSGSP